MGWFFGSKKETEKTENDTAPEEIACEAPRKEDKSPTSPLEKNAKDPEAVLKNILSRMGIDDEVFREETKDAFHLNIRGKHGALLIGRKGQTLDSLEYLLNRICSREHKGSGKKILVDAENYRKKRDENIVSLAQRLAAKVAETMTPEVIKPMSPRERKIVHTALRDHASVETQSEGEGFYKKIVISHKNTARLLAATKFEVTKVK